MVTASQLKAKFLELAEPILDEYVGAALGHTEIKSTNAGCRAEVWSLLRELILKASDTMAPKKGVDLDITVTSAGDVIKAVNSGKITIDEGKQILLMLKTAAETNQINSDGLNVGKPLPILNITLRDKDGEREIKRSGGGERSSKVVTGDIPA